MAQFAWTLRQDPAIESAPGLDRRRAGAAARAGSRRTGSTAAPSTTRPASRPARCSSGCATAWSCPGSVTALSAGRPDRSARATSASQSIGVSLDAGTVAGVGADGTSLLVGNLGDAGDRTGCAPSSTGATRPAAARVGLRRPDLAGRPDRGRRAGLLRGRQPDRRRCEVPGHHRRRGSGRSWSPATAPAWSRSCGAPAGTCCVVSRIQHSAVRPGRRRDTCASGSAPAATATCRSGPSPGARRSGSRCSARWRRRWPRSRRCRSTARRPDRTPRRPPSTDDLRSLAGSPDTDEPLYGVGHAASSSTSPTQQAHRRSTRVSTTLVYVG